MNPKNDPKTQSGQNLKTAHSRPDRSTLPVVPKWLEKKKKKIQNTYTQIEHCVIRGSQNKVNRAQYALPNATVGSALERAMQPLYGVANIVGVFFVFMFSGLSCCLYMLFLSSCFLLQGTPFLQVPIMPAINRSQCEHGVNNSRVEIEVYCSWHH